VSLIPCLPEPFQKESVFPDVKVGFQWLPQYLRGSVYRDEWQYPKIAYCDGDKGVQFVAGIGLIRSPLSPPSWFDDQFSEDDGDSIGTFPWVPEDLWVVFPATGQI
jgi:hypothetical protein